MSDRATKTITDIRERALGLERLADFLTTNPDIAERAAVHQHAVLVFCGGRADPLAYIVDVAGRARRAGARIEEYTSEGYGGVHAVFGPVRLQVYADREQVCEPVTVGMVPDVRYRLTVSLEGLTGQDGGEA